MIVSTKHQGLGTQKINSVGGNSDVCCNASGRRQRQPTLRASVKVRNMQSDCYDGAVNYLTTAQLLVSNGELITMGTNGSYYGVYGMQSAGDEGVRIIRPGLYKIEVSYVIEGTNLTKAEIDIFKNGLLNTDIALKFVQTGTGIITVSGTGHILLNSNDLLRVGVAITGATNVTVHGTNTQYGGTFLVVLES